MTDSEKDTPDIRGYRRSDGDGQTADIKRYQDDAPLFGDSGFTDLDEYLDHLDDLWRIQAGLPPVVPPELKAVRPGDGQGSRQVGLRLPGLDFRRLRELADEYGIAPATLARMIVVRALRSRPPEPSE